MGPLKITVVKDETCSKCNRAVPTVEFYQRGSRGDNVNQCLYICEQCLVGALTRLHSQKEQP